MSTRAADVRRISRFKSVIKSTSIVMGVLVACCAFFAIAQGGEPLGERGRVDASLPEVSLVPWARIVKDSDRQLSVEELMTLSANEFGPKGREIASFGFSNASYWFLVALENPGTTPLQRLLVFDPTWLDDVQVTLIEPSGAQRAFKGGDRIAFKHRAIEHRKINFELNLPPGRSQLIVRTQTRDPFLVGMTLWDRADFFAADGRDALYIGLVYGVIGAMLLYNLFLFFAMRETVYAAYVAYLGAFLVANATYNGHMYPLGWPSSPIWGNWAHSVFIYMFLMAGLFFAINFLQLRIKQARAYRWTVGLIFLILASFVLTAFFGGYGPHVSSSILWVVVYSPFVLVLGFLSFLTGNYAARYFLIATASGFIGSFITAMVVIGVIPFSIYAYRAVDIGMLVDAILLSLALADRIRLTRAETEKAKAELLEATRSYAQELEETVTRRTLELSDANATKDKFFSIIAHDLRGPIGSLALLFNDGVKSVSDLTDETLGLVRTSTNHTRNLLEELLTWARHQRGEIDCRPETVDMAEVLMETQGLFSAQAQITAIDLDFKVDENCLVIADLAMVQMILRNLTGNALKFTESGGSVRARVSSENDHCRIEIVDTGVGMSAETLHGLFRLDQRSQSKQSPRNESGAGLGLILCKEFVVKNGGAIGVQSEQGKGSAFWFTLPRAMQNETFRSDVGAELRPGS